MATKPADLPERSRAPSAEWATSPERGSTTLLKVMTFLSLRLGRRVGRCLLYLIAVYFFLFAPTARRHAREYLRLALGRAPTAIDRFRQVFSFASTILDRLYLVNERLELFAVSIEGEELMRERVRCGGGAFLMGAHLGSFEIMSALAQHRQGLRVAMAMYEENARKINAMLRAVNPAATRPEIITLGQIEAMLRIRECLDQGVFVGMLGDRTLGDQPAHLVSFLGRPALFAMGPMRAAAILRRPVIFMVGLYRGANRYHIVFEPLADFTLTRSADRDEAVRAAIERYAILLEKYCRSDPYNWFNFYDFWHGAANAPNSPDE
jgi:predicted LPLAT superfamily acyltransferase